MVLRWFLSDFYEHPPGRMGRYCLIGNVYRNFGLRPALSTVSFRVDQSCTEAGWPVPELAGFPMRGRLAVL